MRAIETETPDHVLEVRLFGMPEVRVFGSPLGPLHSRRGLWLIALLALRAGGPIERLQLAGLLWLDSPDSTALHNLRQTLADVRRALGDAAGLLRSESKSLLVLSAATTYVDALDFDAAIREGTEPALERAAALYRGPLLHGCDEPWAADARDVRAEEYLKLLERLADMRCAADDHAAAARWLRLAMAADPYRESAHRALMRSLATIGERAAATQVYRDLRTRLHDDLNAAPDEETSALFREIRERTKRSAPPAAPAAQAAPTAALLPQARPLPTALTELIGREEDVREVVRRLTTSRLVTLTGAGGVGKTRLALRVAEEIAGEYEEGVAFTNLAALRDPEDIPTAVLAALRVSPTAREEPLETLRQHLSLRRMLLVLDNCEHLLEASAGCPKCCFRPARSCGS